MRRIKAFIAYADEDSDVGENIKKCLERCYGIIAFFSPEDTWTSEDFEEKIYEELPTSDLFIPLISTHFHKSIYANQEVGMALAYKRSIFPVSLDGKKPEGFISKKQAYPLFKKNYDPPFQAATAIYLALLNSKKYRELRAFTKNSLVHALCTSNDFYDSIKIISMMIRIKDFNRTQLTKIVHSIKNERCVRDCSSLPSLKKHLLNTYGIQT